MKLLNHAWHNGAQCLKHPFRCSSPDVCYGGEADSLAARQAGVALGAGYLRTRIVPQPMDADKLATRKSLNVTLLDLLSGHLPIPIEHWPTALRANLAGRLREVNLQAFELGRSA